jgi:4-amino-4-deoxy-L-arabinose transferase-like glycosyltransferase
VVRGLGIGMNLTFRWGRYCAPVRRSGAHRDPPAGGGLRHRYHPLVWAVVALHLCAALAFSLLIPMFRSPDEAAHVDMLQQYRTQLGHDDADQMVPRGAGVTVANDRMGPPDVRPRPPQLEQDATPRRERPSFTDLAPPGTPSTQGNHMTQHPPLYYAAVSGASTFVAGLLPSGLWSWDREMYLYRLFSILLTAPIPLLAAEGVRAIGLSRRAAACGAAIPLLVPQATAVGSSVNNDALVMAGAAVAVAAGLWHLGTGTPRSAWTAAGAGAVAALSKSTAAAVLAWVVLLVAVTAWGHLREARTRSALAGTAGLTAAGASWYVSNWFRYADIQPTGLTRQYTGPDFRATPGSFFPRWSDRLSQSFWGLPARRTGVSLPWQISHGLTGAVVLLAVAALTDRRRRRATVLLVLLMAAQVILLAQTNWRAHARTGALPAVQGRYLFAILVPLAVVAVVGARQVGVAMSGRLPRPSPVLVGLGVASAGAVLHVLLGISMLQGFWGVEDASMWERVRAVRAWSPLPAAATLSILAAWVLGTAALVAGFAWRGIGEVRNRTSQAVD